MSKLNNFWRFTKWKVRHVAEKIALARDMHFIFSSDTKKVVRKSVTTKRYKALIRNFHVRKMAAVSTAMPLLLNCSILFPLCASHPLMQIVNKKFCSILSAWILRMKISKVHFVKWSRFWDENLKAFHKILSALTREDPQSLIKENFVGERNENVTKIA